MQGELRIAKENCRRMEDRMRGVLKERSELVTTIKNLSPGKAVSGGGGSTDTT